MNASARSRCSVPSPCQEEPKTPEEMATPRERETTPRLQLTSQQPAAVAVDVSDGAEKADPRPAAVCGGYTLLAWGTLGLLVVQNSTLTLTMRASRLENVQTLYLSSSAVVVCEGFKVFASIVLLYLEMGSWRAAFKCIHNDIFKEPLNNIPVLVPAGMYTLQNNLQYVAASNLDPAVFQVLYQMKLVTTALLYVVFMRKSLSPLQWLAVVLLTVGIILVQLAAGGPGARQRQSESMAVGCGAVFIACLTSAAAGLYLEFIMKFTRLSMWIRNLQMGVLGLILGLVAAWGKDAEKIREHGFLVGFTGLVWGVILLQSFGGLLTAVVLKQADNVIKGFATGLAIIVSCLFSAAFFGFVITQQYLVGAATVVASVLLYSMHQAADRWLSATAFKPTGCRVVVFSLALAFLVVWFWFMQMPLESAAARVRPA
eukprot:TRINITY_DN2724_c0_g2_i1.p1 TRINITY_DN2724_c0_g2~~TRINITY_DN2724_c0_g2_i1.p1  ORF type:complete len:429 (+),score=134.05 TRINITY_DN2724_c0_g2_i1:76-1362(+)